VCLVSIPTLYTYSTLFVHTFGGSVMVVGHWIGLLIGAVVAALVAILLAPLVPEPGGQIISVVAWIVCVLLVVLALVSLVRGRGV
jgi:hypothetical protein